MLAWLLHHFRCGAMARNRFFAYSISPAMLSSQKMILLPWKEAYSAATSATGRLRSLWRYITATVQKSHWLGHPRVANRTPLVRSEEHTSELQSLRHLVC